MKNPWAAVSDLTTAAGDALLRSLRAHGKPVSRQTWEHEYRNGAWDRLHERRELPRYMVIAGYVADAGCEARILDVGCGDGRLFQVLPESACRRYIGIDFSTEALSRARLSAPSHAKLVLADFEAWSPPESMDVIVFNESLYYSRRPVDLVDRYSKFLGSQGRIIISMFKPSGSRRMWRRLDSLLQRIDGATVSHDVGMSWTIGVFVPRSRCASSAI